MLNQTFKLPQWSSETLAKFATANDLRISPYYADGKTPGTPTWIWSVVADGRLYVRAWHGLQSRWYRSAVAQGAGRMYLAGQNYTIQFVPDQTSATIAKVDAAYQQKYGNSPYLSGLLQSGPQQSTLVIYPQLKKGSH